MCMNIDFRIRTATVDDLEACARCWGSRRDTYPSIYPLHLAKPALTLEERLIRNQRDLGKILNDPHNVFQVAVSTTTTDPSGIPEVVGYSVWAKPEAFERDVQEWQTSKLRGKDSGPGDQSDPDPECNHELAGALKEESMQIKHKIAKGERIWFLQQLFVSADYQRRGIGTKLLEHGIDLIEREENTKTSANSIGDAQRNYKIGLTSSPQGQALYKRYGFTDVYWFNPHFDDIDERGEWIKTDVRWPLMIRK